MKLYPLVEPMINYSKNKLHSIHHGTKKVVSDLHHAIKTKAHRMLAEGDVVADADAPANGEEAKTGEDGKTTENNKGKTKCTGPKCKNKKSDGTDGAVVTDDADEIVASYPK